uniref:Uncharacterized protein n=1 Tax=Rhizophora mucronata TaxID=61149 RepID=A0A2P2KMG2_RHIMU
MVNQNVTTRIKSVMDFKGDKIEYFMSF